MKQLSASFGKARKSGKFLPIWGDMADGKRDFKMLIM
jgi:hypothetical protein